LIGHGLFIRAIKLQSEFKSWYVLRSDTKGRIQSNSEVLRSMLSDSEILFQRDAAVGQMRFAREYTLTMISDIPFEAWYEQPAGIPTHLAWQVGHLAVAEYGLMLFRQRGRAEGDLDLMPGWLRKKFSRGTSAVSAEETGVRPEELLDILDKIHKQAMLEAASLPASSLGESTDMPYAVHPLRLGALMFCPLHESIHAGQIGMLRRLLGKAPIR
jgi:hypothetical protein